MGLLMKLNFSNEYKQITMDILYHPSPPPPPPPPSSSSSSSFVAFP